jgi:hypothetical protein
MRAIKLMADYQCSPLWEASPGVIGNIDPGQLPISERLRRDLTEWADRYNSTLNHSDPAQSGFPNDSARAEFKHKGLELGERLKNELGDGFAVEVKV